MTTKLYVSYGSNLCKWNMRRRCPNARALGKFMLTQARLVFRGVADVEFDPESQVPCALWRITPQDEKILDTYEGVKSGFYFKSEDIVLKYEGQPTQALIYLMTSQGIYPPSQHYVDLIRRGYEDFGLDVSYLEEAVKRAYAEKDPQEQELERRARQRKGSLHRKLVEFPLDVALKRLDAAREQVLRHDPWKSATPTKVKVAVAKAKKKKRPDPSLFPGPTKPEAETGPRLTERNAVVYGD